MIKNVIWLLLGLWAVTPLWGQGYDDTFEMKNKLKAEFQYADYLEYEYPEQILYNYDLRSFVQLRPYLDNFPERRALVKFTRAVGPRTALSAKYQYSDIREDVDSHLFEGKVTSLLRPGIIGLVGLQATHDTRGFTAWQPGVGIRYDIGPATILQGDVQYYRRGRDAVDVGGALGSWNLRFKWRQVLTLSTAMMVEFLYYDADGDALRFNSKTLSLWISQFLPTQTAVHVNLRLYTSNLGIRSVAPSLEVGQYLNWATILNVKYRYYQNESDNVSLGESDIVVPDGLKTHAISVQLLRELNPALQGYLKVRHYQSNQQVSMNTYLAGLVYAF